MLSKTYPVEILCHLLDCPRSSYYYQEVSEDVSVRDAIEQIAATFPHYGYRRVTAQLARQGQTVNHKRVLRIIREECLLVSVKRYVHAASRAHAIIQ